MQTMFSVGLDPIEPGSPCGILRKDCPSQRITFGNLFHFATLEYLEHLAQACAMILVETNSATVIDLDGGAAVLCKSCCERETPRVRFLRRDHCVMANMLYQARQLDEN